MAVIAMVSAKGAPGVSTAALACTLAWSDRTLLAECDPAGGDILAGYLAALKIPGDRGLLEIAKADLRDQLEEVFWGQLIDLDAPRRQRLVLPGIADPAQAAAVRGMWQRLAAFFAELEYADPGYDVIADCGRLAGTHTPWPVLARADVVLLVLRPTSLRSIHPATPALAVLRRQLTEATGGDGQLGLMLIGDGDYSDKEIERALRAPVIAHLPDDRRTAAALCGVGSQGGSRALLRHAASAQTSIRAAIARRRHFLGQATGRADVVHHGRCPAPPVPGVRGAGMAATRPRRHSGGPAAAPQRPPAHARRAGQRGGRLRGRQDVARHGQ